MSAAMTRQQHLDRMRQELRDFAQEMIEAQQTECAVALLRAETAITDAVDVLAENGVDLDEGFYEVKG